MVVVFVIVGKSDKPLFQEEFGEKRRDGGNVDSSMAQFILHASLDVVEEVMWTKRDMLNVRALKAVDQYKKHTISAYVSPSNAKFLLLHSGKRSEEAIKNFFVEVHELFVKVVMNPFYEPNTPITTNEFREKEQPPKCTSIKIVQNLLHRLAME